MRVRLVSFNRFGFSNGLSDTGLGFSDLDTWSFELDLDLVFFGFSGFGLSDLDLVSLDLDT